MIFGLLLQVAVLFVNAIFSWIPAVTVLPTIFGFNMDSAVSLLSSDIHGIVNLIPPLQVVYYCLLWYYSIKLFFLSWKFVRWFIGLIRGSGS